MGQGTKEGRRKGKLEGGILVYRSDRVGVQTVGVANDPGGRERDLLVVVLSKEGVFEQFFGRRSFFLPVISLHQENVRCNALLEELEEGLVDGF